MAVFITDGQAAERVNYVDWINNGGSSMIGNYPTTAKIYSCKIYDNGVLMRDFWLCYDPDGVACLYDKVEKKYYYNAGTGEFIAGEAA